VQGPSSCRAVVLGGTGFLGTEVANAFSSAGVPTLVVARHDPASDRKLLLSRCEIVLGDVGDGVFLDEVLEGASVVVYAVGCPFPAESNRDPVDDVTRTLPPFLRVLQSLRAHSGTRFFFLSSGGTVYGNPSTIPVDEHAPCNPITSYGIMKFTAEKYVAMYSSLYGLHGHVLRISNAYGRLQYPGRGQGVVAAFLAAARADSHVSIYGTGDIVRDYVHTSDIARAIVELSKRDTLPPVLNVGSGVGYSIMQVLDIVRRVSGKQLEVQFLPDRPFDVRRIVLDVQALSKIIPWSPLPLSEGVELTWREITAIASSTPGQR